MKIYVVGIGAGSADGMTFEARNVLEKADVIVANILAAAIVELSGIIKPYLKENGIFISSGIIIDRLADVLNALEAENFKLVFVQQMGEWVGVVAQKRD